MEIHHFFSELGQQLGLPELKLDDDGCCRLSFDESIQIDFEYDDAQAQLYAFSSLAPLPVQNKARIYEDLLRDNLFGRKTAGASFAINAVDGDIVLFHSCQIGKTDYIEGCNWLEGFIATVEYWKEKLYKTGLIDDQPDSEPIIPGQYIIRG